MFIRGCENQNMYAYRTIYDILINDIHINY